MSSTSVESTRKKPIEQLEILEVESGEMSEYVEGQEVKFDKNFNLWSVIGMVYSSFATPIALGTYLSLVIGVGGSPFFFYSYIFVAIMSLLTAYSVAEISSALPHSSAQIYWTQEIVKSQNARGLSYIAGFLSCACFIFGSCATAYFQATLIIAFGQVWHPEYVSKTWHIYLVYMASCFYGLWSNVFGARYLPLLSRFLTWLINLGAVFIFIALLARAHPKQSAAAVFKDVVNNTGWDSDGIVFLVSLLPGATSLVLFDGACHMTDEVPEPEKTIPLVICYSYTGAAIIGVFSIIIYVFCIVNPDNLLAPVGGQPLFQLFIDSYKNMGLTTVSCVIVVVFFCGANVTVLASSSRLIMSFGKLRSIPYGKHIGSISARFKTPVWSLIFITVFNLLIGLLMFASTAALNAIIGSYVAAMYLSYVIPFVCLILRKDRFGNDSKHYFNLGRWGRPINIICLLWFIFITIALCIPTYHPVTPSSMNYTCATLGCVAVVGAANWFLYAKKNYQTIEELESSYE